MATNPRDLLAYNSLAGGPSRPTDVAKEFALGLPGQAASLIALNPAVRNVAGNAWSRATGGGIVESFKRLARQKYIAAATPEARRAALALSLKGLPQNFLRGLGGAVKSLGPAVAANLADSLTRWDPEAGGMGVPEDTLYKQVVGSYNDGYKKLDAALAEYVPQWVEEMTGKYPQGDIRAVKLQRLGEYLRTYTGNGQGIKAGEALEGFLKDDPIGKWVAKEPMKGGGTVYDTIMGGFTQVVGEHIGQATELIEYMDQVKSDTGKYPQLTRGALSQHLSNGGDAIEGVPENVNRALKLRLAQQSPLLPNETRTVTEASADAIFGRKGHGRDTSGVLPALVNTAYGLGREVAPDVKGSWAPSGLSNLGLWSVLAGLRALPVTGALQGAKTVAQTGNALGGILGNISGGSSVPEAWRDYQTAYLSNIGSSSPLLPTYYTDKPLRAGDTWRTVGNAGYQAAGAPLMAADTAVTMGRNVGRTMRDKWRNLRAYALGHSGASPRNLQEGQVTGNFGKAMEEARIAQSASRTPPGPPTSQIYGTATNTNKPRLDMGGYNQ